MRLGVLWASERDRLGRCPRVAIHVVCRNAVCERDPGHTTSQDKTPQKWWFDTTQGALKRLERDDRPGVQNARNGLDLLVDKMADVGAVLDIELHQQVEVAGGRIDFGRDLRIRQRIGHRVGFAEVALDLNKKRGHAFLLAVRGCARNPAKPRRVDKSAEYLCRVRSRTR